MHRELGRFMRPAFQDERRVVLTSFIAAWNLGAFGAAAFWTDKHPVERGTDAFPVIGAAGATPLAFRSSSR